MTWPSVPAGRAPLVVVVITWSLTLAVQNADETGAGGAVYGMRSPYGASAMPASKNPSGVLSSVK